MSETPISPLRRRMMKDVTVCEPRTATRKELIRRHQDPFGDFSAACRPAALEGLHQFQVRQSTTGPQPSVMNNTVTALHFLFRVALDRPEMARHLTLVRLARKLPNVLNRRSGAPPGGRPNGLETIAALSIAYGAGLRMSKITNLKNTDINSSAF